MKIGIIVAAALCTLGLTASAAEESKAAEACAPATKCEAPKSVEKEAPCASKEKSASCTEKKAECGGKKAECGGAVEVIEIQETEVESAD